MHTLHHGDCLSILPTLAPQSVDAVICDPPYGTTACKWDSIIPFAPMWEGIRRVLRPRGAVVLFGSQPFTSALVMSNPAWFRYSLVWDKRLPSGSLDANRRPLKRHEDISIFSSGATKYAPQMRRGVLRKKGGGGTEKTAVYGAAAKVMSFNDMYYPTSILEFSNADLTSRIHPTQKPLALLEYLVRTYTDPGDTVLDFAFGSGTTGHACINLGRAFVGIEQDAAYFAIAQARIDAAATRQMSLEEAA